MTGGDKFVAAAEADPGGGEAESDRVVVPIPLPPPQAGSSGNKPMPMDKWRRIELMGFSESGAESGVDISAGLQR